MPCASCDGNWTSGKWIGSRGCKYVFICQPCGERPGAPGALQFALESEAGPKRWDRGTSIPTLPYVCVHQVPLHLDSRPGCAAMAEGKQVCDRETGELFCG